MIPGIIAGQGGAPFDPTSYGLSSYSMWWAEDPALGYADGATVTTWPAIAGSDANTLSEFGAGTTYFRSSVAAFNNKPTFEMGATTRLATTPTNAGRGGIMVFRQKTVVSSGGIVASGTNTRIRNLTTNYYQMRYSAGTGLSSNPVTVDTSAHVLAWFFNDAGNETLWLDGTTIINAASADSGAGMGNFMLNYDNAVYGDLDCSFACMTAGDPTADGAFASLYAGLQAHYATP